MSKWISVKDKLPEPSEAVIFSFKGYAVCGYMINRDAWYEFCLINNSTDRVEAAPIMGDRVKYWMPLPEPPEK